MLFQKLFNPVVYLHLHVSVTSVYCPIYGQFYTQQASRIDYLSHSLVYQPGLGKKILIENTFIGRRKLRLGSTKYFLNVNYFKYFIEPNKEPKSSFENHFMTHVHFDAYPNQEFKR